MIGATGIIRLVVLIYNVFTGKILSVETVKMQLIEETVNTEMTYWREDVSDSKHVVFAFRIYTQLLQEPTRQTIGTLRIPTFALL